jgi:hypothetical protein
MKIRNRQKRKNKKIIQISFFLVVIILIMQSLIIVNMIIKIENYQDKLNTLDEIQKLKVNEKNNLNEKEQKESLNILNELKNNTDTLMGKKVVIDKTQLAMIEYYSEFNFKIGYNLSDEIYYYNISSNEIMRSFGEENFLVIDIPNNEKKQISYENQYLCLIPSESDIVSCVNASIYW